MTDKPLKEISPLVRIAADKAHQELGDVKGLLSSKAGDLILSKYEESEDNRNNSFIDPLTGLLNRRGLVEEYKLEEATRERITAFGDNVLVALDLIGLKKLNVELSPEGADRVIKMATASLRDQVRKSDLAGRWGGDEFLLILFGANQETAISVIKKILANLPEHVHYNIGYKVFKQDTILELQMNEVMNHMEAIKLMGDVDKTGRPLGKGVVFDIDNSKKIDV